MKAGAVEFEDAELVFVAIEQPLVNAQNLFVDLPLGRRVVDFAKGLACHRAMGCTQRRGSLG
jgi:hypothetical protein